MVERQHLHNVPLKIKIKSILELYILWPLKIGPQNCIKCLYYCYHEDKRTVRYCFCRVAGERKRRKCHRFRNKLNQTVEVISTSLSRTTHSLSLSCQYAVYSILVSVGCRCRLNSDFKTSLYFSILCPQSALFPGTRTADGCGFPPPWHREQLVHRHAEG